LKSLRLFWPRPRTRIFLSRLFLQDQNQDFIFCPQGALRPRPWSRGLHHCTGQCILFIHLQHRYILSPHYSTSFSNKLLQGYLLTTTICLLGNSSHHITQYRRVAPSYDYKLWDIRACTYCQWPHVTM